MNPIVFIKNCFKIASPEVSAAKQLIKSIDRGGIPLNPMKVNQIARKLNLEVSTSAPMSQTIERIRDAIKNS
jgi:hypothetical protein